jgi:hypothetical protein
MLIKEAVSKGMASFTQPPRLSFAWNNDLMFLSTLGKNILPFLVFRRIYTLSSYDQELPEGQIPHY